MFLLPPDSKEYPKNAVRLDQNSLFLVTHDFQLTIKSKFYSFFLHHPNLDFHASLELEL